MKYLIFAVALNLNAACGYPKSSEKKTVKNDKVLKNINDSLLNSAEANNINDSVKSKVVIYYEDAIKVVISKMFSEKNIKLIDNQLDLVAKDTIIKPQDKRYWKAYMLYNKSIFYKKIGKNDDKSSATIDLAIEILNQNEESSENLALLASCKLFSIQFANMTQLAKISAEVVEDANKALSINPKNVRAYYVLASNNFYTPKMFGGMTQVEEYALKGLACPNSADNGFYSPYWAKPLLYSIYIKYLEGENRKEDALKYRKLAKSEFPKDF